MRSWVKIYIRQVAKNDLLHSKVESKVDFLLERFPAKANESSLYNYFPIAKRRAWKDSGQRYLLKAMASI